MHDLGEPLRVVLVREVAGVGDHLDPGGGRQGGGVAGVADRDHPVVAAPDHRHRHRLGEVGAVGHGDDLALPVDDRADHVPDRGPGGRVAERVVDLGHLVEVAGRLEAGAGQRDQPGLAEVPDAGEGQQPHHLVEAGRGDRPDRRAHLGAEAAGGDQDHPLGALGELVGELHRHPAAEAVPDHGHLVDAEHGEQVAHAVGVAADAVVGARLVREPVAEQVGGDHRVAAGQRVDHRLPGRVVAAQPVQQQQRRPLAGLDEGAAVAVDGEVLDLVPCLVLELPHGSPLCGAARWPRVSCRIQPTHGWPMQGLFITCWPRFPCAGRSRPVGPAADRAIAPNDRSAGPE